MKKGVLQKAMVLVLLVLFTALGGTTSAAQDPIVTVTITEDLITWIPRVKNDGIILTIIGPDFQLREEYDPGARPTFRPYDDTGDPLLDGTYKYELQLLPVLGEVRPEIDETERGIVAVDDEALVYAGAFAVVGGRFATQLSEATGVDSSSAIPVSPSGVAAPADQCIYDDLISTGSFCVGFDCTCGMSFGFDTIVLKEHNLRILFDDTSYTASYPRNDWRITINSSSNGGASYFGIDDVTGGRSPFRIEAGAPNYALYVDDYGRVGFGTSTPVVEAHIRDSDTPTVRLEQDSSGGWTAQTWDVAGNETNFFIRDATNGSKLPFRIRPSAPSNSLFIDTDGDVGLGTSSPGARLEVETTGSNASFWLDRTDGATAKMAARGGEVRIGSATSHPVRFTVNDSPVAVLDASGNLTIDGTLTQGSDVNLKENFAAVDGEDVLASLADISISTWSYKTDADGVRHMGPMAQDFYAAYGLGSDDKHISTLDVGGVTLAAIKELDRAVKEKDAQIQALQEQNAELETRLTALEQAVGLQPESQISFLSLLPWLLVGVLLVGVGMMGGVLLTMRKRSHVEKV